jgi:hypothetical protein
MEVYFDEKIFLLDDYLTMNAHGVSGGALALKHQDKGHKAELEAFQQAVAGGGRFPIPWDELLETWSVSQIADRICREGEKGEDFEF